MLNQLAVHFVAAVVLVTISYFVLVSAKKTEGFHSFGIAVAVLLWVAAAFAFVSGFTGGRPGCGPHVMKGERMAGALSAPQGSRGPMGGPGMGCPMLKKMGHRPPEAFLGDKEDVEIPGAKVEPEPKAE